MRLSLSLAILLGLAIGGTLFGEEEERPTPPSPKATEAAIDSVHKQRSGVQHLIDELSGDKDKPAGDVKSDGNSKAGERLTLIRSLDAALAQQETLLEQRKELETQLGQADAKLAALDKFDLDEPKPYSFLLLESLEDQSAVEESRETALKTDLKSSEKLLKTAHEELDAQAKSTSATSATKAPIARDTSPADLSYAVAREKVKLKQLEIEVQNLRLETCKAAQKQLSKKIEVIKKDVKFSAQDRDTQLERLTKLEADLQRRRSESQAEVQKLDTDEKAALAELEEKKASPRIVEAAKDAWRIAGEVGQTKLTLLDQELENLTDVRKFWKRRYQAATSTVEPDKLQRWLGDVDEFLEQLEDTTSALEHRRDVVRADPALAARAEQAADEKDHQELAHWTEFRETRLKQLRELTETRLADIHSLERTLKRFRDELKKQIEKNPGSFGEVVATGWKNILEHKVAEDEEQSVTVGRLLVLLMYLVIGIVLAYLLSRFIGRRLLVQLGVHRGTADAFKSIMFYAMCVFFGVLAFQLLHIPLAAFAFVGGAAAIAIGFGGQDIMNNFMSGIILLAEQPIRVGDVVEIGSTQGVVLHIGLRSTRLQTQDNHELIVPNKSILDEQVTNLTLSDNLVQTFVTVCLDRTVPTQLAMDLMLKTVFSHPLVIKSPHPVVLMKEFDPYWSTFEVHFWLEYASYMKCAIVQSQITAAISAMFPEVDGKTTVPGMQVDAKTDDSEPRTVDATDKTDANGGSKEDLARLDRNSKAMLMRQMKRLGKMARF